MSSITRILFVASTILGAANAQGVIISAQGSKGSPASLPLQIDQTSSSDANIINLGEVSENVVNECGRTLLAGNIDIGQNTENQLANKTVTSVTKGSTMSITIKQVNADGAGPYTCDLDESSNGDGTSGQTPLTVKETDSSGGTITLAVTMPNDMACIGASTGNVCTVRCFNTAAAGPFGGCVAVQQTDVTPNQNTPDNVATAQTLEGILAQVAHNQIDLPAAVQAVADATNENQQGVLAVDGILKVESTALAVAITAAAATSATSATSTVIAAGGKGGKAGRKGARIFRF